MPFNLFRKKKQPEPEAPAMPPQEEPKPEAPAPIEQPVTLPQEAASELTPSTPEPTPEATAPIQEQAQEALTPPTEEKPQATEPPSKTYLKAMPLRELADIEKVKQDVLNGNIIILRVTPLAGKSIEDVKSAVNELYQFAESIGGDIARLGEERVVICPKTVRIWREKTPAPVSSSQPLPTAA